jgi:hypothetical protein
MGVAHLKELPRNSSWGTEEKMKSLQNSSSLKVLRDAAGNCMC